MAFYSYAFTANYKRFFTKLKAISKAENRSFLGLVFDTGWCILHYGMALTDYLNYKIYNRTAEERKRYAGVRHQNCFYETVNPSEYKKRFTVKPTFLKEFAAYTKRDFIVPAEDNYEAFLSYIQSRECFMSKPYDGIAGQDVKKVYSKDITDPKAYFEDCIANRIFLEDLVIQHPGMNVLCPASVNTLRIMTFNDHGKSRILWMGLRIGNGVHAVDNFHARGMVVGIDPETGRLIGNAVNTDNEEFSHHPTTGVQIDGFQIPCFEEAKELVLKAALESDKILVVGWDVAISENGPLIIEGNRRPGFVLPQVAEGRGRLDIMEDVLSCLKK
jgi:hypothetical protein